MGQHVGQIGTQWLSTWCIVGTHNQVAPELLTDKVTSAEAAAVEQARTGSLGEQLPYRLTGPTTGKPSTSPRSTTGTAPVMESLVARPITDRAMSSTGTRGTPPARISSARSGVTYRTECTST